MLVRLGPVIQAASMFVQVVPVPRVFERKSCEVYRLRNSSGWQTTPLPTRTDLHTADYIYRNNASSKRHFPLLSNLHFTFCAHNPPRHRPKQHPYQPSIPPPQTRSLPAHHPLPKRHRKPSALHHLRHRLHLHKKHHRSVFIHHTRLHRCVPLAPRPPAAANLQIRDRIIIHTHKMGSIRRGTFYRPSGLLRVLRRCGQYMIMGRCRGG